MSFLFSLMHASNFARLVNTILGHDYYLVGDDFDSCKS
jgi:hypothetical protein